MNAEKISFSAEQFRMATAWRGWEFEDTSYGLGFPLSEDGKDTILVRDILVPAEHELERSRYYVRPSPEFHCRLYNLAKATGASYAIQIHDHPFSENPCFSGTDDDAGMGMARNLRILGLKAQAAQLVFGNGNRRFSGRTVSLTEGMESFSDLAEIEVLGAIGMRRILAKPTKDVESDDDLPPAVFEQRNVEAFGTGAIDVLHKIRVLILGGGGLGSAMGYLLSHLGVRHIVTLDCQRIEASNVNREYFVSNPNAAIGRWKASFLAKAMRRFNRTGKFRAINGNVFDARTLADAVKAADVVVATLDKQSGRSVASSCCARYGKPLLNVANAMYLNKDGRLESAFASCQWFFPRETGFPCLKCQGAINEQTVAEELMPERLKAMRRVAGYVIGTEASPAPQVIPINSVAAGIAAWELVMWAGGIRSPSPWIHYDIMNGQFRMLKPQGSPECTVCGNGRDSCLATGDVDINALDASVEDGDPFAWGGYPVGEGNPRRS